MTEHFFRNVWSTLALDDWRRLPPDAQVAVAHAVERFPEEGVVIATGPTECLLLVGAHAVVLLIDGDTIHVDRVRRA
jgi:hypothetical protein